MLPILHPYTLGLYQDSIFLNIRNINKEKNIITPPIITPNIAHSDPGINKSANILATKFIRPYIINNPNNIRKALINGCKSVGFGKFIINYSFFFSTLQF